jgi:beta-galactosidase
MAIIWLKYLNTASMKLKFKNLIITVGLLFLSLINGNYKVLYIGANYHPHDDKNIEKIKKDIDLMKEAGFLILKLPDKNILPG